MTLFYDADGNLTNYNGWTFIWNGENRLVTVSNAGVVVQNTYDYKGRRVVKEVYSATNNWSRDYKCSFVYDQWNPISEICCQPSEMQTNTRWFVWGLDLSGTLQGAGGVGGLIAVIEGKANSQSEPLFVCYDANGNITEYVSTNGTVAAYYQYDPYGNIMKSGGAKADELVFRFSTKYLDTETGLYYYGYRFYSPDIGRWVNRDPIGEVTIIDDDTLFWLGSEMINVENINNVYRFIKNMPISWYDYLGLKKCAKTYKAKCLSVEYELTLDSEDSWTDPVTCLKCHSCSWSGSITYGELEKAEPRLKFKPPDIDRTQVACQSTKYTKKCK